MITNTAKRKLLTDSQRAIALTAIAMAKRKHKHVGIRPKKEREHENRTAGILVPQGSNPGTGLDSALADAGQAWPDDNSWEVFGADDFEDFPDDNSCDDLSGDAYFDDTLVYGEFETMDEPGWMGGYPV